MTVSDKWLVERALKRKAEAAQTKTKAPLLKALPSIDGVWKQLQEETRRQATIFTDALGDPSAVVVETPGDAIDIRVPDGRQLTLRVDRNRRRLTETFRNSAGAVRMRTPIIAFVAGADGEPTFNFGGVQAAAGSLLRRLLD